MSHEKRSTLAFGLMFPVAFVVASLVRSGTPDHWAGFIALVVAVSALATSLFGVMVHRGGRSRRSRQDQWTEGSQPD